MKFLNLKTPYSKEQLIKLLSDNDFVSSGVKFDEKLGRPMMHLKEKKDGGIRMTCELTDRPTRDDSFFLLGTYFKGKIIPVFWCLVSWMRSNAPHTPRPIPKRERFTPVDTTRNRRHLSALRRL